jgi:apolipoprotein N-acyltransferase
LPEASLPFSAFEQVYPHPLVERVWMKVFGEKGEQHFPSMGQKNSSFLSTKHGGVWRVSNAFWLQALANRCNCEVVAGMEDDDRGLHYNAALHFLPGQEEPSRYEKRILVPIGEYVPLQQSKAFAEYIAVRYGIASSYTPGEKATICKGRLPLGISICLEETYSQIVRQLRSSGAELLVNLSNDGWFPRSKLSRQHFDHGIMHNRRNRSCRLFWTCAWLSP